MARPSDAFDLAGTVAHTAYEKDVKYPAAALAYYAFVSFVPMLVFAFAIVGERVAVRIYTATPRFLTPSAQQLVYEAMTAASGRVGAALLAIVVLAWSGANVAVDFQTVVERVEEAAERPLRYQLRDSVVVLGSIGLAILSIIVTSAIFGTLPAGLLVEFVGFAVLFVALVGAFVPLYYVPSRAVTTPSNALAGAITAAFGWTVIHAGVQFYAVHATRYAIYGVLSGIMVILTSLYFAAIVLMVGIIVNATLADEDVA